MSVQSPSSGLDAAHAHALLADLGFLLVPGAPFDRGAAYLLVALRPRPTRAHFDPERIDYWAVDGERSGPAQLEWPMGRPPPAYAWGTIRITDRLAATNRFVSFGGSVAAARDRDVHAALFRSEAPILALGGHSGPADPLAFEVAGFMARLRGTAGYDSPVKRLADRTSPTGLYAAFLVTLLATWSNEPASRPVAPRLVALLRSERRRLEQADQLAYGHGLALAEALADPNVWRPPET